MKKTLSKNKKPFSRTLRVDFAYLDGAHIDFIVCNEIKLNWEAIKNHYKDFRTQDLENSDGSPRFAGLSRNSENGDRYIVVSIDADCELVSHECFHAVYFLFSYHGIMIYPDSANEHFAYPFGNFVGKCWDFLQKTKAEYKAKK